MKLCCECAPHSALSVHVCVVRPGLDSCRTCRSLCSFAGSYCSSVENILDELARVNGKSRITMLTVSSSDITRCIVLNIPIGDSNGRIRVIKYNRSYIRLTRDIEFAIDGYFSRCVSLLRHVERQTRSIDTGGFGTHRWLA